MKHKTLFGLLLAVTAMSCGSDAGTAVGALLPPPPPAGAANLLFHTTLDGVAAVTQPATGTGAGVAISTAPPNDFVAARIGLGLRADALGERVLIPQTDGRVQNVELDRGTMEFWYQPFYNHNDNLKYTIVGSGNWLAPGALHFGKHNDSNANALFLIFYDANGARYEHDVLASDYSWRAGDWLLVRLTWDFGLAAGDQNVRLYINGRELRLTGQVARGRHPVPPERPGEMIYLGSRDLTGTIIPSGLYDEFRIWDRAIPPP